MAEDVARAVGASGGDPFTIAGKEVQARALTIKELAEVERDCLKRFRRHYLESYSENLDLLSESNRDRIMQEKIEESAKWDMSNLPPKYVVDWQKVQMTERLKTWIKEYFETMGGHEEPKEQKAIVSYYKKLAGALIDQGVLSEEDYKELTDNAKLPKTAVPYVAWWITGSTDGRITMLWLVCKPAGVTREQVETDPLVVKNQGKLLEIAQEIERLTAPSLGNG